MKLQARGLPYTLVRIVLGIIFLVNAPVGVFNRELFATMPGGDVLLILWSLGPMMYLVKLCELFVGLALVTNRFVPLALLVITPVLVNIILVQALGGPGVILGLIMAAMTLYLALTHWNIYRPLLKMSHDKQDEVVRPQNLQQS
jgi:putative oxidoreductase